MKNLKQPFSFKVFFYFVCALSLLIITLPAKSVLLELPEPEVKVSAEVSQKPSVRVLGTAFGIKIYANGVMVVGTTDVNTVDGLMNPATNAGIQIGDVIISINNTPVLTNEEIADLIAASNGNVQSIVIKRDNVESTIEVIPVKSIEEEIYRIGIWVRDSSAGIGTLTFYSPDNNIVCGLGHGIEDSDTNKIIPLDYGELVNAEINSVVRGIEGRPGQLQGNLTKGTIATATVNDVTGIYGDTLIDFSNYELVQVASKTEVVAGPAQILTTVDNTGPHYYNCQIELVHFNDNSSTKNFIVKVIDRDLILKTGGIVQGMSGSPIIQNGKLIGAVTHVFLNSPTKGYGIFAENMLDTAQSLNKDTMQKAS